MHLDYGPYHIHIISGNIAIFHSLTRRPHVHFLAMISLIRLTIQVRKKHYRHLENDPEISRDHIFPNHRPMLQTPRMISER